MPIHDWTRVLAGLFHDFHHAWISELRRSLNRGLLPAGYYALAEQVSGPVVPDVLTLRHPDAPASAGGSGTDWDADNDDDDAAGGLAVAVAPPRLAVTDALDEATLYAARQSRIGVYDATDDHVVAVIELASRGNQHGGAAVDAFVDRAVGLIGSGVHLQVVDLFPPGRSDPAGLHGAVWDRLGGTYAPPAGKPLAAAAYAAAVPTTCYVEPLAVGDALPDLPLFLTSRRYVNVPLEATYRAAYADVPDRWKRVIEGAAGA